MSAKRRWPRRLLIAVFVLIALYAGYRYTLHRLIQAKLDEIRRAGYPVTLAELDKWYPQPPSGENAADIYLEAFKHFAPKQDTDTNLLLIGSAKLPPRGEPLPSDTKTAIAEYLGRNEAVLKFLHQAARYPRCRYPVDLKQGYAARFPHQLKIAQSVRLLAVEALMCAERGETNEATRSILTSLTLARSLATEPTKMSQLVQLATYRTTVMSLQAVLNRVSLPDESLSELATVLSELNASDALVRGCAGERCLGLDIMHNPVERLRVMLEGKDFGGLDQKVMWLRISGLQDIYLLQYLELMEERLQICRMPLPEAAKRAKGTNSPVPPIVSLAGCIWRLGGNESEVELATRTSAQVTAGIVGLAIERYRLNSAKAPDKLDELVPKYLAVVPQDPFNGKPLRYKKLAKGYIVYSVGEDCVDDGGDEKKDITFTVER